ncbi:hypothetical protein KIW84_030594 [Lathyrus oleraceus]|uniref:RING-type E3 ubiquitin transferase n=1 Tax=Pisum sativum TaxID=3888 RepID=A0A9D4XST5_PEA|nr:hypothetical protein KIW84_030594 [Pisum sativum]
MVRTNYPMRNIFNQILLELHYCSPQNFVGVYQDAYLEDMEERINSQLIETEREVEAATDESFAELLNRRRKEAEDALRVTVTEQQKLLEESENISGELQMTMRNVALLNSRAKEATCRRDGVAHGLLLIQTSISTLWQERQQIRRQKMESLRWLERWKSRGQIGAAHYNESFKIAQGGFGIIYKREMLGRTVAIKKFHQHNVQGPTEFHREVQILSSLQHPPAYLSYLQQLATSAINKSAKQYIKYTLTVGKQCHGVTAATGSGACNRDSFVRTSTIEAIRKAAKEGLISSSLDDLALDIPSAKAMFQSFVPKAISEGWLDASFTKPVVKMGNSKLKMRG